jgi:hypothetical protein
MIAVEVHADRRIPRRDIDAALRQMARLDRYSDRPVIGARLSLRRGSPHASRPWGVDCAVQIGRRFLVAHATGYVAAQAAEEAVARLRRQLLRAAGANVALRNEPRTIAGALRTFGLDGSDHPEAHLKPPDARVIVRRRTYLGVPLPTFDAIDELIALDVEFLLFRHARTGEDVVVHHRDDRRIGLLFPPGSVLADEDDVVVPRPSRYDHPLTVAEVRQEMDLVPHRFLYFGDAGDGHGKVMYLRRDGDYGLVEPA